MTVDREKIRNIAVIAHIDHGKTTLLDSLLTQANTFEKHQKVPERIMDSGDQERERGITIFSKHTSVYYEGYKINIIDTPGHADFSGEVERVLGMVNSVLLVVDAKEGPMPQTRFVLSKALKMGIRPIVVLNKIDRPQADPDRVLNETFDLFVELGATDEQLDFTHCCASALEGYAMMEPSDPRENMRPLFDLILKACPAPDGDIEKPFLLQVATVGFDDFLGRQGCGRILQGKIAKGDRITHIDRSGKQTNCKISRIQGHHGIQKVELEEAGVGDIVMLAGVPEVMIGDTLSDPEHITVLPAIEIEEPTVSVDISVNTSPFVGKDGKHVTINKIRERLEREQRANITYRIEFKQKAITVCGRGELHLSILIETMRREGYEMSISKPQVIVKEIDGVKQEPIERAHVEVPAEHSGMVIEELSRRKGEMTSLATNEHNITALEFLIPTRGLMGYRNEFLTATRGEGILTSIFDHYAPWKGKIEGRKNGVLISTEAGKSTAYSIFNLQARGSLFVDAGDAVYEGMVVGQHNRDNDLQVNVVKGKQLTNVRSTGTDTATILTPPRRFTLEQAIDYIADDELIEVTPLSIRLRKRFLTENERKRNK